MTADPLCGNCSHETPTLAPCPCGLGPECPLTRGICDECHRIILRNARLRAGQRSAA